MPTTHTLTLGDYQTNTYIVTGNGKTCAIIDPGFDAPVILSKVQELGLTVDAILLTHGHMDHVGAALRIPSTVTCSPSPAVVLRTFCFTPKGTRCLPAIWLSLSCPPPVIPRVLYA